MPKGKKSPTKSSYNTKTPSKKRTNKKAKKSMSSKLEKVSLPSGLVVSFGGSYYNRAKELYNAGKIDENSIIKAIQYDIKNFDVKQAGERLIMIDNVIVYSVPIVAGYIIDQYNILPVSRGWNKVASRFLYGIGAGQLLKTVTDPKIEQKTALSSKKSNSNGSVQVAKKVKSSGRTGQKMNTTSDGGRFSAM